MAWFAPFGSRAGQRRHIEPDPATPPKFRVEPLEPRLLLSGDPFDLLKDQLAPQALPQPVVALDDTHAGTSSPMIDWGNSVAAPGDGDVPPATQLAAALPSVEAGAAAVTVAVAPASTPTSPAAAADEGHRFVASPDPLVSQVPDAHDARGPPRSLSFAAVSDRAIDLTLRLVDDGARRLSVELTDNVSAVTVRQPLADTSAVDIIGSDRADVLTVESGFEALADPIAITFAGGAGLDTLIGPAVRSTWRVTGADAGTLGSIAFSGVENLIGAGGNDDTFVIALGGSISGRIDGGRGGFDTLVIADGAHHAAMFVATGPDSGAIDLDGATLRYAGLEPITLAGTASDLVVNGSAGDDQLVLEVDPSAPANLRVRSTTGTIESVSFARPTSSLTVSGGAGTDSITIDHQTIALPGADLTLTAETVALRSATVQADDVTLSAAASATAGPPNNVQPGLTNLSTTPVAAVEIDGTSSVSATGDLTVVATAAASVAAKLGAQNNQTIPTTIQQLLGQYAPAAANGNVSVASVLAISDVTSTTTARLASTGSVVSATGVTIESDSSTDSTARGDARG